MTHSLKQFLAAVATDPQKLKRYLEDPEALFEVQGLTEADKAILSSRDAAAVTAALGSEAPAPRPSPPTEAAGACPEPSPGPVVWAVPGDRAPGQPGRPKIGLCIIMDDPVCDPATWVVAVTEPCPIGPVTWVVKLDQPLFALQKGNTPAQGAHPARPATEHALSAGPGAAHGVAPLFPPPPPLAPGPVTWSLPWPPPAVWSSPSAPQPQPGPVIWVVPSTQYPGGQPAVWSVPPNPGGPVVWSVPQSTGGNAVWSVPPTWLRPSWGGPGWGGS